MAKYSDEFLALLSAAVFTRIQFSTRNEPQHGISNNVVCANSLASDQSVQTRSLIRAFASRLSILRLVKLLTEHHLEFLSLKGGCLSESTIVKIPHCWNSHVIAQMMMIMILMMMIYSELSLLLAGVALRDCPPPLTCSCLSLGVLKNISSGNEILINRPLVKSAHQK